MALSDRREVIDFIGLRISAISEMRGWYFGNQIEYHTM